MMLWFQVGILIATFLPISDRVMSVFLMLGIVIIAFAFIFGTSVHARSLCEPCISEMPLNGPQKAEDWERYLAAFHWLFRSGTLRYIFVLAAWLAFNQVTSRLLPDKPSTVLVGIPAIAMFVLIMRHTRVMPWCKRCGWDEGGGKEITAPSPDPAVSR